MIAETRMYQLGQYTILERPRTDNPAWPVYIIRIGLKVVGRGFSKPSLSDCEWLAAQEKHHEPVYAEPSPQRPYGYTAVQHEWRGKSGKTIRFLKAKG